MSPNPGTPNPEPGTVRNYTLLSLLGPWGLGESYRARDTRVGRTVALRLVSHTAFPGAAEREAFLRDARAAATLSHPNIAALFEVGESEEDSYLAYEFASGTTLRQEIHGRAMHPRRAVEIGMQVADALADAHAQGMVHGDLRPDTVMITLKGSAKLLETGMSRWTRGGRMRAEAASTALPNVDLDLFAPYLSPEEIRGAPVDARTDVFSLGVLLYEMITGRTPFGAATPADTRARLAGGAAARALPSPPSPPVLASAVGRAIAIDPAARHQSMASLAADLRRSAAALDASTDRPATRFDSGLDDERSGSGWWVGAGAAVLAALAWWTLR